MAELDIAAPRSLARAATWSGAVAALWVVLAIARPETTFHLAPLLAAAAGPAVLRFDGGTALPFRQAAAATAIATAIASGTTILLAVVDALEGPALVGGSALGESLLAVASGSALGLVVGLSGRIGASGHR